MTSTGRESLVRVPAPGTYVVDPRRSTIAFRTRHLFGLGAVTGTFTLASARILVADPPEQSTVQAAVDAATFNTGTPGRDKTLLRRIPRHRQLAGDHLHLEQHPADRRPVAR